MAKLPVLLIGFWLAVVSNDVRPALVIPVNCGGVQVGTISADEDLPGAVKATFTLMHLLFPLSQMPLANAASITSTGIKS